VLLGEIRRNGMGSMTVTSVDAGNIMETGNRSGVGNDGDGCDGSVITVDIGRGDL